MESRIPGLGGVFLDGASGKIVVYLPNLADRAAAMEQLRAVAPTLAVDASFRQDLGVEGATVVRQGQFAFSQLVAWQQAISSQRQTSDIIAIDADEASNRVRVTVADGGSDDGARAVIANADVPSSAVVIDHRPRASFLTSVRDRIRPTGGGIQLQIGNPNGQCTLGLNVDVQFYGERGFLTAAHCNYGTLGGGDTAATAYQNTAGGSNIIGTVELNPAWNSTDSDCGVYTVCTDADVMFVRAADTTSSNWAKRIAYTTTIGLNNSLGSTTISSWYTGISIVPWTFVGQHVYKTSRTTGSTRGTVMSTCENHVVDGTMVLCAQRVDSSSVGQGDSGAPIYYPPVSGPGFSDPPYAIGILSSGGGTVVTDPNDNNNWHCVSNCYYYFTDFYTAQTHLSRYFTP